MKFIKNIKKVYKTKDAVLFLAVLLLFGLAYGFYRGIQDNYLAEIIQINEFERGIVEFARETPGLLLIFILALLYRFDEQNLMKISISICAVAMAAMAASPVMKIPIVAFMVLFSVGEHMLMPSRSSIAMHVADRGQEGLSLGIATSVGNIGTVAGYAMVAILFMIFPLIKIGQIPRFKIIFAISSLVLFSAFIVMFFSLNKNKRIKYEYCEKQSTDGMAPILDKPRLYFRKKFTTFYILELFYGARKQIFLTFGPYVLILIYGADTKVIATLYMISAVAGIAFMPLIGKCIDALGYKTVMVCDTILLIFVCIIYGFAHRIFAMNVALWVVMINFVLDTIISQASIASSVYVKDLSTKKYEITATLTTGISINHMMSILIALLGGAIWRIYGVEFLFIFAALCAFGNTIFALTIKNPNESLSG